MNRVRLIAFATMFLFLFPAGATDRKFIVFVSPGDVDSNPVIDVLKPMIAGTSRFSLGSRETADFEIYITCVRASETVLACSSDVHYFHIDTAPLYSQVTAASGIVIASSSDNAAGLLLTQFLKGTSDAELESVQALLKKTTVKLIERYSKSDTQ